MSSRVIICALSCLLLAASPAVARELQQTTVVSAKCSSVAQAFSSTSSNDAIAEAAADASAIACGTAAAGTTVSSIAEAIARASATAIASTAASCQTSGAGASGCASSTANAQATASAAAEAWAKATADSANKCGCEAQTEAAATTYKEIVVNAHASSSSSVCTSGNASAKAGDYVESFVSGTITAFAEVLAQAYSGGGECNAITEATVGTTVDTSDSSANEKQIVQCEAGQGGDCDAVTSGMGTGTIQQFDMPQNFGRPQGGSQSGGGSQSSGGSGDTCYDIDNGQSWYSDDDSMPPCRAFDAISCCKKVLRNSTDSNSFADKCSGCNFVTLGSNSECNRMTDCNFWGTCGCSSMG